MNVKIATSVYGNYCIAWRTAVSLVYVLIIYCWNIALPTGVVYFAILYE